MLSFKMTSEGINCQLKEHNIKMTTQYHKQWKNIFDKEELKGNINLIALFITIYELLEDRLKSYPKDFYTMVEFDEQAQKNYEEHVMSLYDEHGCPGIPPRNKTLIASLIWFKTAGAINDKDIKLFTESRKLRNKIVHEMLATITEGTDSIVEQFAQMYDLFRRIERWWILEVEVPISGDFPNLTEEEANGVMSGYMVVLDAIIDILATDSNKNFKEICEQLGVPIK